MVKLRQAGTADLKCVEEVEQACFDLNRFEPEIIETILGGDHFVTWLAEDGGCVGYASLMLGHGGDRLISIAVLPEWRKRGVGHALLDAIKEFVDGRATQRLSLEVRVSNVPAVNLYLRSGFRIKGMIKDYYASSSRGGAEDALYMVYEPADPPPSRR